MAEQAKAGDVGQCVHGIHPPERRTRRVELSRDRHHGPIMACVKTLSFERGAVNADAKRLAQNEDVARASAGIALYMARINLPDRDQAVDRLDCIDGVPARDRNANAGADRFAAFQNPPYRRHDGHGHRTT